MDQKIAAGKKTHLDGILRIFAKSVQDAAGNKKKIKSLSLEEETGSEGKGESSLSLEKSPTDRHKSCDGSNAFAAGRTRCISETSNVVAKGNGKDETHHPDNVIKIVSLDNLMSHTQGEKDNLQPNASTEDWGTDLLDVESLCDKMNSNDNEKEDAFTILDDSFPYASTTQVAGSSCLKKQENTKVHKHDRKMKKRESLNGTSNDVVDKKTAKSKKPSSHRKKSAKKIDKPISSLMTEASKNVTAVSNFKEDYQHIDQIMRHDRKCSVPAMDEDWSSDLLDTSSCSSRTSKDDPCETFNRRLDISITEDTKITLLKQGYGGNGTGIEQCETYSEVFADNLETDLLDRTLTKTTDEDWSSDLLNVPSSRNTSPLSASNESFHEDQNNSGTHDSIMKTSLETLCFSDKTTKGNIESVQDYSYSNVKDYYKVTFHSHPVNPVSSVLDRFVDDGSDLTSDQETLSELESQAPSTVESLQDDTVCSGDVIDNLMSQERDQFTPDLDSGQLRPNGKRSCKDGNFSTMLQTSIRVQQKCKSRNDQLEERVKYDDQRKFMQLNSTTKRTESSVSYPFLYIPVAKIRSKETVEKLLDYIENHLQMLGISTDQTNHTENVVFSVGKNSDEDELRVRLDYPDLRSTSYSQNPYSWPWACNPWMPYIESATAYPMFDPRLVQNAYYSFYEDHQSDYPCYFGGASEGTGGMPLNESQQAHQHRPAMSSGNRIVDYDSSSEDERLALLANRHRNSNNNPVYDQTTEKSYASCLVNQHSSKRSLQETQTLMNSSFVSNKEKVQKTSGSSLQRLGTPKQERVLPGSCIDWNRDLSSEGSDMYEQQGSERSLNLVDHAKSLCDQYKNDINSRTGKGQVTDQNSRNTIMQADPKMWCSMRRNKNIIESDLDDSVELEDVEGKENMSDDNKVKSPGCYPYLSFGKIKLQSKDKGTVPPLLPAEKWATWATMDSHDDLKQNSEKARGHMQEPVQDTFDSFSIQKTPNFDSMEKGLSQHMPQQSSPVQSPPVVPVCHQPFWGDPRMGYPFPAYYPSHWMPGYLPYPSAPPQPPPPTHTPTSSASTSQGCNITTSTPPGFSYQLGQYASARSRTTSAPPVEVEKILHPDNYADAKSCKNFFLAGKNRRVSDSVLRSDADSFTPKRSSYASRLQNDARLNANFPQLDWKIRFKSRCKSYGYNYVDSHCHLDFLFNREGFKGTFAKYMSKHEDSFPENFEGCVAVFCNPATFLPYGGLWKDLTKERNVWLTMGCHPKNVTDFDTVAVEGLKKCILHPRIIAVGEIGLDYSGTFRQHEELQKKMFAFQLQLALDVKKPLVIHCRQAEEDCLAIMEKIVPRNYKIHCHCFTGTYEQCKKWLTKFPNLYIGLTNLVSFRSATPTHEVARHIPLSRLLLETDAPYFVPRHVPKGEFELSHPGMAVFVAEEVAKIKGVPVGIVLKQCRSNTLDMYGV